VDLAQNLCGGLALPLKNGVKNPLQSGGIEGIMAVYYGDLGTVTLS
jgi:hypothetical protein